MDTSGSGATKTGNSDTTNNAYATTNTRAAAMATSWARVTRGERI
jgi:hypothetical protein